MASDVILTGIRANQDLTIGNYFGAILPIIDMAKTPFRRIPSQYVYP
jgi:tryptophanyl-tRNA synthetase